MSAETEYIMDSGGTLADNGNVIFDVGNVPANEMKSVSFKVKVLPGKNKIVNDAMFDMGDVSVSIVRGYPVCSAN